MQNTDSNADSDAHSECWGRGMESSQEQVMILETVAFLATNKKLIRVSNVLKWFCPCILTLNGS